MASESSATRPNILLILADDMGYSDLGCYGSEIETPHLDQLAANGVRMVQFYNTARCCPSRASLLTGLHPHQAGMGLMSDQSNTLPSYQGYLNEHCVTIAELLGKAGYHTSIAGKWHVGEEQENWPDRRGFQRSFAFIHGAGSYFDNHPYRNAQWPLSDGEVFTTLDGKVFDYPDGTYSTDLYTDYALSFIREAQAQQQPFFLYLAYTAPHWPLHARTDDIAKYKGQYDKGWDRIRNARLDKQQQLGLMPATATLSARDPKVPDWETLNEKEASKYAQMMEVYAAMIDRMDQNIGRILSHLEKTHALEHTLIVFLSDNGACPSENIAYRHERFSEDAVIGSAESFSGYGTGWANVSNTPFRNFKSTVHEGGIASPLIAHFPDLIPPNTLNASLAHICDIMPTCLELAGVAYPESFSGYSLTPLPGHSLLPAFSGNALQRNAPLCFEHNGNQAILDPPFKMVMKAPSEWELYDLSSDRIESHDLMSEASPDKIASMLSHYHQWCDEVGVFPKSIVNRRTLLLNSGKSNEVRP